MPAVPAHDMLTCPFVTLSKPSRPLLRVFVSTSGSFLPSNVATTEQFARE